MKIIQRKDVKYLKKKDFLLVLLAAMGGVLVGDFLLRIIDDVVEEDSGPDEDEVELVDEQELAEMLSETYDQGFADGHDCDYYGDNVAAQVLQEEVADLQEEVVMLRGELAVARGEEPEVSEEAEEAGEGSGAES